MKSSVSLLLFIFATTAHGQTSATWTGAAGNWSDGTQWSTTPTAPINGQPLAGDTYNATLDNGQTITLDTPVVIQAFNLNSGTVTGANTLTVNADLTWTSGTISCNNATDILNATGGIILSGGPDKYLRSRTLNHGNGISPSTASWTEGAFYLYDDAIFNNKPVATFSTNFDGFIGTLGGTNTFNNQGIFTKSGGNGETSIFIGFNNSGTVNVNSGTLSLGGNGIHTGIFNIAAGRTLNFNSGTHVISAGASFTDTTTSTTMISYSTVTVASALSLLGALNISGGTATLNNTSALNTLEISNGTLTGSGTVTATGSLNWTSGTISGTNATDILNATGGIILSGGPDKYLRSRTLNHGNGISPSTASWTEGAFYLYDDAIFNNKPVATFSTNFDGFIGTLGGTNTFNNQGIFTKSGGAGETAINVGFNNSGTVNVNSGTLALNGGVTQHNATTLTGGTWNVTNGASINISTGTNITTNQGNVTLDGVGSSFAKLTTALATNQGALTLKNDRDLTTAGNLANSGTLRVEDSTTLLTVTGTCTQSGGSTTLVGGAQLTASNFNLNGGTLAGTGTINGNLVSSGSPLVAPGLSAGSLTVSGNATLSGTLAMEIGGRVPGTGHDQLLVGGGLTVGGNLSLALISGFVPAYGQNLTLADAGPAISGSFANVASGGRLVSANGIHSFVVHYGPSSPFGSDKIVLSAFSDNVAPVLTLPANMTQEATGPVSTPVTFVVSANDAIQGPVTATATPASGSGFALGDTTVNVTASDVGGNTANNSFTVTVVDTTAPQLTVPASPMLATTLSTAGATVNFSVSATDVVDPAPVVAATPNSGSNFPLGDTKVNVTATDAKGNQATGNFIVRVTGLPDIFIKETGGPEIDDGGMTTFGPVALGKSSAVKSLTVRNDGATLLNLGAISLDGSQPTDFTATPPVASSLAPGQSTTFSLTFTPAAIGSRNAAFHLASNDPDVAEAVFDIELNGAGFDMKLSSVTIVPATATSPAAISGSIIGGPPYSTIRLQASTDFGLTDPWVSILSLPLDATGAGTINGVTDPGSTGAARDFFRVAFP